MDKFSKLKPKDTNKKKEKGEVIFSNDYMEIINFEDWTISKEKDMIVCILYFIESNQFLIRYEYIPTFKYVEDREYWVTVLSGGVEDGEEVERALFREIEEEAGVVIKEDYVLEYRLKPLFISKGHVNKYHPFIIPLNEGDYHEVISKGGGSKAEKMSKSVKVDYKFIDSLVTGDLITDYMLLKLKEYIDNKI